jgi:hypothetical protein
MGGMKTHLSCSHCRHALRLVSVVFGMAMLADVTDFAAHQGWVSLFNGKNLEGWTIDHLPGDKELAPKAWTVDSAMILANTLGRKEHFYILLATQKDYGDFVLRLKFQVDRGITGNSGVQMRSRQPGGRIQAQWLS